MNKYGENLETKAGNVENWGKLCQRSVHHPL